MKRILHRKLILPFMTNTYGGTIYYHGFMAAPGNLVRLTVLRRVFNKRGLNSSRWHETRANLMNVAIVWTVVEG